MLFAHDTEMALLAAVRLANSAVEPDTHATVEALDAFYEECSYTGRHRRTREERDEAVRRVNALLAEHRAVPRLTRHDGWDWHLHAVDDDQPLATRIAVSTAMAMIDVIRADEMSRLSVCADDECDGVVLDLSRNRSRRFCSTTCGNRNAVAAYRERQRS